MSALERWLMEMLLAQDIAMLRAEADIKAKVLALLITMQRNLVSLIANSPDVSELTKLGRNTLLREATAMIEAGYGSAQAALDLRLVGEVESLAVKDALMKLVDLAPGAALPVAPELRAAMSAVRTAAAANEAALATAVEIRLGVALPTENYLKKLASDALIQGAPSRDWWARQSADTAFKLANEIRSGAALGETNQQIIKRIVGEQVTAKAPAGFVGPPGVMPLARKNAAAVVQTAMQTVAAEARRKTMELNRELTNGIMQVSTLDVHTSLTCVAYDGATWDVDYEPSLGNDLPYNGGVPRHWNCRSSEIALMKTFREMGIDLDEPDEGARASSSGQVSSKTKFADYLKLKGEDYQNEVLGKGRAELFRSGKLAPRDLVDMSGSPLKLTDLRSNRH